MRDVVVMHLFVVRVVLVNLIGVVNLCVCVRGIHLAVPYTQVQHFTDRYVNSYFVIP